MRSDSQTLLSCPIRGPLDTYRLAKDGLTVTEEARRIEFLQFLLKRKYPKNNISVETVILKGLGESGRNKLRCDVIVYDRPVTQIVNCSLEESLDHAILVAEIKRDSARKKTAISCQLEPAMRLLPGMNVLGVYWDDVNHILFAKKLVTVEGQDRLDIVKDTIANLPTYGVKYRSKPITYDTLTTADNLMSILMNIANIMRSHGCNDEHTRYKETVKLLLARYCDERQARSSPDKVLQLQVFQGQDVNFMDRLNRMYDTAAQRYSRATTLFRPVSRSELKERTLREIVEVIQGVNFSAASNSTMQQVFMSFVPAVFKKSLDQYFTPISLINSIVHMVRIGPNDTIADPAMGTADFLTAAMEYGEKQGDADIVQRIYGVDSDQKAYDLAVVNMILNKD